MPHPTKLANSSSDANGSTIAITVIKVGATGTVASLMSRELDNVKITQITPQDAAASSSSSANIRRKKYQSSPVSVPCGANAKKIVSPKKSNLPNEEADMLPRSVRRNGHDTPAWGGDCLGTNRNPNTSFAKPKGGKKGHLNTVEVVDLKCNNPMSSRLRKLGFSKLSESIA